MVNLLKHEMYKFFRSFGFKVFIIIVLSLAIFSSAILLILENIMEDMLTGMYGDYIPSINGSSAIFTALSDFGNIAILLAVVTAFVVINEFKANTFKNTLMYNKSRLMVYSAKYIMQVIGTTVVITSYALVFFVLFLAFNGWGEAFTFSSLWNNALKIYLLSLLLSYGLNALINFIAYLTENTVITVVITIILTFLLGLFDILYAGITIADESSPILEFITDISFVSVLKNYYNSSTGANLANIFICFALMFAPFIVGGYFIFYKKEIK